MRIPPCEWCGRESRFQIVARWSDFWACDQHDVAMAWECVAEGVVIMEINEITRVET